MQKTTFKVISLFSGCGGSDLGMLGGFKFLDRDYTKLPITIVYSVDHDKKAVATYNANFQKPAVLADIRDCDPSDILEEVDIVVGGFPCQSFSTVNPTKDPFDERGMLYKQMARYLKRKQPQAFIAENVKGLARLHKGAILQSVINEFTKAGYRVTYKILNAADYGVPQKRERVFIVGIRKNLDKEYSFPAQTNHQFTENENKKWVPLKKVIVSLKNVDKKYYFSERAVIGMKNAKNNMKRGLAQSLEEPCLTITSHLAKVSLNSRDPVLLVEKNKEIYRRFTPLEAARIQSFPDNFEFVGSENAAYYQIGNAISPVLMWHVTKALVKQLEKVVEYPKEIWPTFSPPKSAVQ